MCVGGNLLCLLQLRIGVWSQVNVLRRAPDNAPTCVSRSFLCFQIVTVYIRYTERNQVGPMLPQHRAVIATRQLPLPSGLPVLKGAGSRALSRPSAAISHEAVAAAVLRLLAAEPLPLPAGLRLRGAEPPPARTAEAAFSTSASARQCCDRGRASIQCMADMLSEDAERWAARGTRWEHLWYTHTLRPHAQVGADPAAPGATVAHDSW